MRRAATLFLRGLFLEAIFNPRGRQSGAARWALGRGTEVEFDEPFNANPVLAGYSLGSILSEPGRSSRDRNALAAALSAIGDRLVWSLLRPLAVVAALLAAAAGPIPAAIVLLLVYNPPELALRWRAIRAGLEGSGAVLGDLSGAGIPRLSARLARLGAGAVGFLCGFWLVEAILREGIIETAGLMGGVVAALLLLHPGRMGTWGRPVVALLLAMLGLIVMQLG